MRSNKKLAGLGAALVTLLLTSTALADDWVATKLRGKVLILVDGDWQPLDRGAAVSDERLVRTLRSGRVTLQRGDEVIELAGDTQVRIHDRSGRKYTTVLQDFGTVSVEADVRAVQHFSVKTPHLAAVVKGTRFTVTSGQRSAEVTVQRGSVAVEDGDTHQSTTVVAGQSAGTSAGAPLTVAGTGELPVIRNADGTVVDARKAAEQLAAAAARNAALADGLSPKEAEKAAREAAKEAREEAKAAEREAREAAKEARGSDGPGNGSAGPGKSDAGGPGKSGHGKDGPDNGGPSAKGHDSDSGRGSDKGGGPGSSGRGSDDAGNSGPGGGGRGGGGGDGGGHGGGGGGHGDGGGGGGGGGHGGGGGGDGGGGGGGEGHGGGGGGGGHGKKD